MFNKRADYGDQVLNRLSQRLKTKYGARWEYQKLQHCVRAAYTFSKEEIMCAYICRYSNIVTLSAISPDMARHVPTFRYSITSYFCRWNYSCFLTKAHKNHSHTV
ncbi:MAG: DUF1016 domain-containing protein [Bacteroidales bacterium]|nr:DUF1016 domain-containing protein [Bacteroidales bacterium]